MNIEIQIRQPTSVTHRWSNDGIYYWFQFQFYNLQIDEFGVWRKRRSSGVTRRIMCDEWSGFYSYMTVSRRRHFEMRTFRMVWWCTMWHGFNPMRQWRLDEWQHRLTISIAVTAKFNWNNSAASPFSPCATRNYNQFIGANPVMCAA